MSAELRKRRSSSSRVRRRTINDKLSGIAVGWAGYQWWGELACDMAANNRCGRETAVACWQQELDRRLAVPPLRRWGFWLLGLISHPPTRLRLWMARWATPSARSCAPRA